MPNPSRTWWWWWWITMIKNSIKVMVFFDMTPWSFGSNCCLRFQDRMIAFLWYADNKLTGLAFTAVNISDVTFQIFASVWTADCVDPKEQKNWTNSFYLRRYSLVWCDYVRLLAQWDAVILRLISCFCLAERETNPPHADSRTVSSVATICLVGLHHLPFKHKDI